MPDIELRNWLLREFALGLATAVKGSKVESIPAVGPPEDPGLAWRQPFQGIPGAIWIVADGEYLDTALQALPALARGISEKLGSEVELADGEKTTALREAVWSAIELTISDAVTKIVVGFEKDLLAALATPPTREPSRTFDLLLDLELPVSISFGRAQVLLRDVLKLNVGSIVELNRTIGDPVEVIVNNCVIARGQVVVIDGNFGVRIQNVISTQERLRSLD